ncbi:MerR family transcriptional regulator [Saccharophagus sp. K07]|jgi:chaperone modulatory protein CbpM|uniref:chaperone modulator CbpM n=1 Tax=Saccharophagus sp. K07 TaxID=2283636 RepID=UPI0016527547|nr:chaperone modulator CbpM [Saccharophagus sp. K07]MBC6907201.1 MerR family transcriptional regulator [Saccharophagus sp. K07]
MSGNGANDYDLLDEEFRLTLADLCRACHISAEQVLALVDEGVLEPEGSAPNQWRFHCVSIRRVRRAYRLTQDLGVNLAGAALALDLLDEIEQLRARLRRMERESHY